jgi:translin
MTILSSTAIERIGEEARQHLDQKNAARERALARSREVIRNAANTIRAAHRRDFDRAHELLATAREALDNATGNLTGYLDILHAGFIHDAAKEYAEASVVVALLQGDELPGPAQVRVEWPAYLNGLGEAVGELRRFLLDDLRRGDASHGEALLAAMDDIYDVLVTMDYPDAITGGLRRTTDVTRGILEKTRGDLTVAMRQDGLERRLHRFEEQVGRIQDAE